MIIAVAGPYSADTEEQCQANLDKINKAAAELLKMGHVPLIGINAALPVVDAAQPEDRHAAIMRISMAVMHPCEAILVLGESKGVQMEKEFFISKGLPVYYSIEELNPDFFD